QRFVLAQAIERAAVRAGDGLGRGEDRLEQAVDVALGRERGADRVELLQALAQVVRAGGRVPAGKAQTLGRIEHLTCRSCFYLMQTERTSLMWVRPAKHFSIPSCFSVRMPSSRHWARMSATRACSWISFFSLSLAMSSSCRPMRPLRPLPPHLSQPAGLLKVSWPLSLPYTLTHSLYTAPSAPLGSALKRAVFMSSSQYSRRNEVSSAGSGV